MIRAIALGLALCLAGCRSSTGTVHYRASGLDAYEIGTGSQPLVLLHGYASTPEEWLPFASTIDVGPDRRFVFPRAPGVTEAPDGPPGGRAWWRLELASYRTAPRTTADMSTADPPGLRDAAGRVRTMLGELRARLGTPPDRVVLGGFSQGAMVTAEVAFTSQEPLEALVLLSGTPVNVAAWERGMTARKMLPVFVAHGRHDTILPFEGSMRLVTTMRRHGMAVTWVPFDGIHEVPASVVVELSKFLADVDHGGTPSALPRAARSMHSAARSRP